MPKFAPIVIALSILGSTVTPGHEIDKAIRSNLEQLTHDYMLWNLTGFPESFWERFDLESKEPERKLLIQIAESDDEHFWTQAWAKRGITDISKQLPPLSPSQFWELYTKQPDKVEGEDPNFDASKLNTKIYTVSIENEIAYVVFAVVHNGREEILPSLQVLRARKIEGDWHLMSFPGTIASLQVRIDAHQRRKDAIKDQQGNKR